MHEINENNKQERMQNLLLLKTYANWKEYKLEWLKFYRAIISFIFVLLIYKSTEFFFRIEDSKIIKLSFVLIKINS